MKKLDIPKETFIGGWFMEDNVIDDMNKFIEENKYHFKDTKLNPNSKTCKEISISPKQNVYGALHTYNVALNDIIRFYVAEFTAWNYVFDWRVDESYNIQWYGKGEGFKKWHCERMVEDPLFLQRGLVFMTYLNDVDDGGTEFYYQNCEVKARKGLTLIWPADWTHTHRGVISHTKEKYIVTGWIKFFQPHDRLEQPREV